METVILRENANGVSQAAALLQATEAVGLPTETVYGLAADALNPDAVARIYQAKGRPSDNPLIVHVTGPDQAAQLAAAIPPAARRLMDEFWPGPLTIVLPKNPTVPDITTGGRPDVGLRSPAHPAFQAILEASGLALAAPSANLAGRPSPTTAAHVIADMNGRIPAILDGGPCAVGVESTVISLAGETPTLLRPGGISLEQLRATIGQVVIDPAVSHQMPNGFSPGAPGMKYEHYAPRTPLTLLSGSPADQARWVHERAQTQSVGVLCFDDDAHTFEILPVITYGPRTDADAQARQLFAALHEVDSLSVEHVYVQAPALRTGVFLAVRNRLQKAAGYREINVSG